MQQLHMSHQQQYDMAQQQVLPDQQQHYDPHVGHKREAEDADCESPYPTRKSTPSSTLICTGLPISESQSCICAGTRKALW